METKKLEDRAKRFGTSINNTNESPIQTSDDILKKRAERFGNQSNSVSEPNTPVGKEILEKRAQRFGINATKDESGVEFSSEKLNKRKERFGMVDEDVG